MRQLAFHLLLGVVLVGLMLGAVESAWTALLLVVLVAERMRSNLLLARLLDLIEINDGR